MRERAQVIGGAVFGALATLGIIWWYLRDAFR